MSRTWGARHNAERDRRRQWSAAHIELREIPMDWCAHDRPWSLLRWAAEIIAFTLFIGGSLAALLTAALLLGGVR